MYEDIDPSEFEQSAGGWWIRVVGVVVYMAIIVAYAIQTVQLVGWLFPADNVFMKGITVFVCDGCATGYAMADMFYRFKLRKSKHIVFGMWIVTFVLSTAASVIQIYLSSTHTIPHTIDANIITMTYGLIIAAYVVNIIAITVVIRLEYGAGKPQHRYLDDGSRKRRIRPQTQQPVQLAHTASTPVPPTFTAPSTLDYHPPDGDWTKVFPQDSTPVSLSQEEPKPLMTVADYQAIQAQHPEARNWREWLAREEAEQRPLAQAPVTNQSSHQNGTGQN